MQIGTNTWLSISAGASHCLAIRSDGTLWAWGFNNHGQLGDGSTNDSAVPIQIGTDKWMGVSANGQTFASVQRFSSFGIRSDGTLWAWGSNFAAKLGLGDPAGFDTDRLEMAQIGTDKWTKIVTREFGSLGLKSDGTLWRWNPVQIGIDRW